ncbi:HU domain-containing protein [Pedobacter namyangjuensis]|uniref:HU domain-containing protein n=1 Tax=Pedobacter namyangjuensis TaxID=600626 RepID=UPI000DE1B78A|nr:hypothetical protein [Pedobacter namyangjuensis]
MDILLYLTELLQTRKNVGVAGLGTFYKKKSPGKYDAEKHAFLPPSFTLAFTTEVKESEELSSYISGKRNISTESANYYIQEFAERIQSQLDEIHEADLTPIGILKFTEGETILVPAEESYIAHDFYGLPEVTDTKGTEETVKVEEEKLEEIVAENTLEEENPGQETEEENVLALDEQETFEEITEVTTEKKTYHHLSDEPPVIETVEKEELEDVAEVAPVFTEEPKKTVFPTPVYIEEEEPKKGMPFFLKVLIALLVIVALGAVVYFVNPQFFNNYFNKNQTSLQNDNVPVTTPDSLGVMVDTSKEDSLAINNSMVTLQKDTVKTKTIDSSKVVVYEVLVSAVATEKKANSIIRNLAKEGISAKKIRLSRTMINISAGSFLAEYPAKLYRDSLRKKLRNEGIYIQPINPKK